MKRPQAAAQEGKGLAVRACQHVRGRAGPTAIGRPPKGLPGTEQGGAQLGHGRRQTQHEPPEWQGSTSSLAKVSATCDLASVPSCQTAKSTGDPTRGSQRKAPYTPWVFNRLLCGKGRKADGNTEGQEMFRNAQDRSTAFRGHPCERPVRGAEVPNDGSRFGGGERERARGRASGAITPVKWRGCSP